MDVKSILLIAVVVTLLWVIYRFFAGSSAMTELSSAKVMKQISPSDLGSSSLNSSNFSASIWFYIDDWNYRYGQPKVIFGRMMNNDMSKPAPAVTLGAMQNDLSVSLSLKDPAKQGGFDTFTCSVANIPIQRWVNLMISVYGRTLDIYINGKLVRTCVMPNVVTLDSSSSMYVTPNGGFSGWTSKFQYFPDASNPQTAWNIYSAGWGGSSYGNLFSTTRTTTTNEGNKFGLKVAFMEGEKEKSVFKI